MERIFYRSEAVDAYTGHPIFIFDTSHLPSPESIDYDLFVPTMMSVLPKTPYVVIMFSGGLNKILWIWGVKFLKAFLAGENENVENLHKVIAVHESWFVKSITQLLTNFSILKNALARLNSLFDSSKNDKHLLTSCDNLAELSNYVDITKLKLLLNIYKHDASVTMTPHIEFQFPVQPIILHHTRYSPVADPVFYHHFYQLFHIVELYGDKVEMMFHKPGNRLSSDILFLCMMRNQILWINDWDLYCIASCFKKILLEISQPVLPVDKISLPMRDEKDYIVQVLNGIFTHGASFGSDVVLFQILDLCHKIVSQKSTKHTSLTILRSLCHALTHEVNLHTNKDRISVGVHFLKLVLANWAELRLLYAKRFKSVSAIVNGEDLNDATIDELYNMSHDITMEDELIESDFLSSEEKSLGASYWLKTSVDEKEEKTVETGFSEISLNDLAESLERLGDLKPKEDTNNAKSLNKAKNPRESKPPSQSLTTKKSGNFLTKKLSDVSNVLLQFPPQKYKFERSFKTEKEILEIPEKPKKRPVVRGRKVGELTRLFEEKFQAMDLLRTI